MQYDKDRPNNWHIVTIGIQKNWHIAAFKENWHLETMSVQRPTNKGRQTSTSPWRQLPVPEVPSMGSRSSFTAGSSIGLPLLPPPPPPSLPHPRRCHHHCLTPTIAAESTAAAAILSFLYRSPEKECERDKEDAFERRVNLLYWIWLASFVSFFFLKL